MSLVSSCLLLSLCFVSRTQGTGSGTTSSSILPSTLASVLQPSPSQKATQNTDGAHETESHETNAITTSATLVVSTCNMSCSGSSPHHDQESTQFSTAELIVAILVTAFGAGLATGLIAVLLTNRYWRRRKRNEVPPMRRTYSYSPNRMSYLSATGKPSSDVASTDMVVNCNKDIPPVVRTNARRSSSSSSTNDVQAPGIYDSVVSGFEF